MSTQEIFTQEHLVKLVKDVSAEFRRLKKTKYATEKKWFDDNKDTVSKLYDALTGSNPEVMNQIDIVTVFHNRQVTFTFGFAPNCSAPTRLTCNPPFLLHTPLFLPIY
ncbi:hypothetical protein CVT24_006354 [Panaeolus cyanescens]|uniref:Uncharacterized protein n=1 Tax=Panaeolus cyanescens TaxID=181874 RepID=A0A409YE94_9AGAR|nr:hypothetical protein CVT24_006354 [Panaeolus cyanescens]